MLLSKFPAAGPSDFANSESISYANSPSRCVSAILVQNGSIFCQSRRLSSERDGKWNFQKICASNRNRTLQLLVKNVMLFWYFWRHFGHFLNGTQWDSISMRKKPSRWKVEFYGFGIFQIEGFLCIEIESKKTFSGNAKKIPWSLFYDVYGDERQNWDPFPHFASKMKVIHVLKQKT